MPNPRVKTDHYENFGGVNNKASKYLTGPREVLRQFNFDNSIVGDLTGRPGSSQYFSATFGGSLFTGLAEYSKLNGYSKIMVAHPGGMWLGQDNSVTGISLGDLTFSQTNRFINIGNPSTMQVQLIPGASFDNKDWDFQTFVDHQFFCDGRAFLKFNGTSVSFWGLPDFIYTNGQQDQFGFSLGSGSAGISNGYYYFAFAYLNDRGFLGPARVFSRAAFPNGNTSTLYLNMTYPLTGFGLSGVAVYSYFSPSLLGGRYDNMTANLPGSDPGGTYGFQRLAADDRFRLLTILPIGQTIYTSTTAFRPEGDIPNEYEPFGQTNLIGGLGGSNSININERVINPIATEIFKNHLFWFCENSSSVFFSDLGQPEGWQSDWEFEFRTNDGDKLRAMKIYGNRLMFGKELSLHELTGDDAENFFPREVSTNYGILNNRACSTWEGRFWFLDRKGIGEYTGGLPQIVSEKIEDVFKRMNLSAARNTAEMIYMKNRDEIWTTIPVDGSSINNLLIIFDTNTNEFHFWDGLNIGKLAKLIGRMGQETSFFTDYQNRVNTFGTSFFGDNGNGFTSLVQFKYENPLGNSVEKLFRKLFIDAESLAGNPTFALDIKLRANYGASYQLHASLIFESFQEPLNFGIPAKSLSVEIAHFSAEDSIRLHGYAMEHRWLRNS